MTLCRLSSKTPKLHFSLNRHKRRETMMHTFMFSFLLGLTNTHLPPWFITSLKCYTSLRKQRHQPWPSVINSKWITNAYTRTRKAMMEACYQPNMEHWQRARQKPVLRGTLSSKKLGCWTNLEWITMKIWWEILGPDILKWAFVGLSSRRCRTLWLSTVFFFKDVSEKYTKEMYYLRYFFY